MKFEFLQMEKQNCHYKEIESNCNPKPHGANSLLFPMNLLLDFSFPTSQNFSTVPHCQSCFQTAVFSSAQTEILQVLPRHRFRVPFPHPLFCELRSPVLSTAVCSLPLPHSSEPLDPVSFSVWQVHGHLEQNSARMKASSSPFPTAWSASRSHE